MYGGSTPTYQIPYPIDGDKLSGSVEKVRAVMVDTLLRAALLGSGGSRVSGEGTYLRVTNADTTSTVTLSGSPALIGVARGGLVEFSGTLTWASLANGVSY